MAPVVFGSEKVPDAIPYESFQNNRPQAVDLILYDQLSVSANSRITVAAEKMSGVIFRFISL